MQPILSLHLDNIFYSDIYDLFLHDTPSCPKKLIISILGSAATKESAELLYKLIDDGLLIEVGDKHGSSDEELAARGAIRRFANQKWVYGKVKLFIISIRSIFKARNCWFFITICCYAADLVFASLLQMLVVYY
jgi:hypothetical protein